MDGNLFNLLKWQTTSAIKVDQMVFNSVWTRDRDWRMTVSGLANF